MRQRLQAERGGLRYDELELAAELVLDLGGRGARVAGVVVVVSGMRRRLVRWLVRLRWRAWLLGVVGHVRGAGLRVLWMWMWMWMWLWMWMWMLWLWLWLWLRLRLLAVQRGVEARAAGGIYEVALGGVGGAADGGGGSGARRGHGRDREAPRGRKVRHSVRRQVGGWRVARAADVVRAGQHGRRLARRGERVRVLTAGQRGERGWGETLRLLLLHGVIRVRRYDRGRSGVLLLLQLLLWQRQR